MNEELAVNELAGQHLHKMAKAMLAGNHYAACRVVMERDADGNQVQGKKVNKIRQCSCSKSGNERYLEVRYANKAFELPKGKISIVNLPKDKIAETIETVIRAVGAKELDGAIVKITEEKEKGISKST